MKEIEIKILEIDKKKIQEKLLSFGAKKVSDVKVIDNAFDNKNEDIKKSKSLLRLRSMGKNKVEFTFKCNRHIEDGISVVDEFDVEVSDFETTKTILQHLGYKPTRHRERQRISYKLDDTYFEIDHYPTIPPYLEIEGTKENIKKYVDLLGYTMDDVCTLTASQVLKHYGEDPYKQVFSLKESI